MFSLHGKGSCLHRMFGFVGGVLDVLLLNQNRSLEILPWLHSHPNKVCGWELWERWGGP